MDRKRFSRQWRLAYRSDERSKPPALHLWRIWKELNDVWEANRREKGLLPRTLDVIFNDINNRMGISRDSCHKRFKTGATRPVPHKKRKFEMGRPAANTKIGARRVRLVRTRGGNHKYRALRIDSGNFSWASEQTTRKTRITDVVYNATGNELVRGKTLVKGTIISVDATPFRQWWEAHYAVPLARKNAKLSEEDNAILNKKRSNHTLKKFTERRKTAAVDALLAEQFRTGRLLARVASSPGQVGQVNGYVLEGKELEFYLRKIRAHKGKK